MARVLRSNWQWWVTPSEVAWWWMYSGGFVVVATTATISAGVNWPSVLGTFTAAGIAGFMAWAQQQQQRLMEQQRLLHEDQIAYLTFLPVLTGTYKPDRDPRREIEVHNIGNGPAMDLRATLYGLRMKEGTNERVRQVFRGQIGSHLAAKSSLAARAVGNQPSLPPGFEAPRDDVWIIHCRDLNARIYHLVSNSTSQGHAGDKADHTWRFWRADQTPGWVRDVCTGCEDERDRLAATQCLTPQAKPER